MCKWRPNYTCIKVLLCISFRWPLSKSFDGRYLACPLFEWTCGRASHAGAGTDIVLDVRHVGDLRLDGTGGLVTSSFARAVVCAAAHFGHGTVTRLPMSGKYFLHSEFSDLLVSVTLTFEVSALCWRLDPDLAANAG